MNLKFEPVMVHTGSDDEEGLLVFANDRLVAVLVRLSKQHEKSAGCWFVESSFGIRDRHRTFTDVSSAEAWISGELAAIGR